jgi:cytochrome c-type biogenesis protein CcmH
MFSRCQPQTQRLPREGGGRGHWAANVWCGFAATLIIWGILLVLTPAHAVQPDEILKDPVLEARARHLSQELRCLVCQNQSIDDSNAELARDLRVLVRERLTAGDSDDAVLAFVEARYGEFVLLRPRVALHTALLWLTPLLLLAGTALFVWRRARLRASSAIAGFETAPLSPAEQQRLDALLASDGTDAMRRKR